MIALFFLLLLLFFFCRLYQAVQWNSDHFTRGSINLAEIKTRGRATKRYTRQGETRWWRIIHCGRSNKILQRRLTLFCPVVSRDDRERPFQYREQGSKSFGRGIDRIQLCLRRWLRGVFVSLPGESQGQREYVSGMANTRPRNGTKETLRSQSKEKRTLHVRSRRRTFVLRCT